ncbi:MAG TPA: hypothetical protein VGO62_15295 [Myxococcota bacterium]|jgi:hypothetical protein
MKFTPKLPHTVPKSLQIVKPDVGPLVKARTHEKKAEALRDEAKRADEGEGPKPAAEFLERWKALEFAVGPTEDRAKHEYRNKLGTEPKEHEIIGHVIASLPRPRMDALFRHENIGKLNVVFGHRDLNKIVVDNELLQDLGIDWRTFVDAKRDFKFQLGIQTYKSAQALAVYLTVVRAAADVKVRKTRNFVTDVEVLGLAGDILRDVTTHIIEEMQSAHDTFFAVGDRKVVGEQFRIDRAKKSGRAVPAANAPKGRATPVPAKGDLRPKGGMKA